MASSLSCDLSHQVTTVVRTENAGQAGSLSHARDGALRGKARFTQTTARATAGENLPKKKRVANGDARGRIKRVREPKEKALLLPTPLSHETT
jgi:hypothetical protein